MVILDGDAIIDRCENELKRTGGISEELVDEVNRHARWIHDDDIEYSIFISDIKSLEEEYQIDILEDLSHP